MCGLMISNLKICPLLQVSAKLKLVRLECIDSLIHNTLEHDNLVSLCFAPMLKNAWNLSLIREINASASATLRNLTVNFRCFFLPCFV